MAKRPQLHVREYWHKSRWHKLIVILILIITLSVGTMYGVARWYIRAQASKPLQLGVSFIPAYAESLGVDPQQTMDGLLDIGVKNFRLVSYWDQIEQTHGSYDFTQLDWQFQKAEARHAKIILTVGLRQPRWPECHMPDWAQNEPINQWQPQLEAYMQAVINRYKGSPSLDKYQLENEYFLKGFGLCTDYSRQRLVSEYNLVKKLDPGRTVIVGRSNNALGFPTGQPQPDEFSISVYKRVWDAGVTHRYLEYPYPAWYYGWLAGAQKIFLHKDMAIGELQAEAWAPNLKTIKEISLNEQNKSLNAQRLKDRFEYGKATGMREIYAWGAEYWYYRQQVLHDPSLWNVAHQKFRAN
ncbi:hypothetical protein COY17_03815 [Candidatus Saccharibacteria bacterium CG_4_10_14_0_2_um_filter_52_9]|nr:MAG: hypothetical protein COY17_03815 [Candidatus Saccharibacteria bacterium CG_4_10_14_0_2_um_filter_52_9]